MLYVNGKVKLYFKIFPTLRSYTDKVTIQMDKNGV